MSKKMETWKLTRKQLIARLIIIPILLLLLGIAVYENYNLGVTYYTYTTNAMPSDFDGYRIVQISDFHNAHAGPSAETVYNEVIELHPDIIVITGDMIDSRYTDMDKAVELADLLTDIAPTYYINGNHECRFTDEEQQGFYNRLRAEGVCVLIGRATTLMAPGSTDPMQTINLVGLNDDKTGDLEDLVSPYQFNLVLAHEPQYFHQYSYRGADLTLSGHAHGGQFRIPFTDIGLVAPGEGFFPEFTSGVHTDDNGTMIISRGIGNSAFPLRLFNNPEIVVIDVTVE